METNEIRKGALARKLAKILGEIGAVKKTGHNSFHDYDYVTENDLVHAVRGRLAESSIFVFSSVELQHVEIVASKNKDGEDTKTALTTVTTRHTFVDGDSGEEFSVLSQGQGADNGDKGGYKAITGAMKYFLYKCFMIPTGDDPEADEKTDDRTAGGTTASTRTTTSSDKPSGIEVRRDENPVTDAMTDKYRANKWEPVSIHFGKNKGRKLGELESKTLRWYVDDWYPKPFHNKWIPADLELRAALNAAGDEAFRQ